MIEVVATTPERTPQPNVTYHVDVTLLGVLCIGPNDHTEIPRFWQKNGDIILSVEDQLFKVHSTRLKCSVVFATMFELPQPEVRDTVDGCPCVTLADGSRDWLVTLSWMYGPELFEKQQPAAFETLSSALRISNKYDITELRDWAVRELLLRWPKDVETMSISAFPNAAEAIRLARECDVPEILPSAFYALSVQRWNCGAEGGRSHLILSPADLRRLISGREIFHDMTIKIMTNPLGETHSGCPVCEKCCPIIEEHWRNRLASSSSSSSRSWLLDELRQMQQDDGFRHLLCPHCAFRHQTLAWNRLRRLKEKIPRAFSL